ncbi:MAG: hypothetical protein EBT86_08445 [Actinobacteria bacterium]|nr:hypothetical protein [Actinomycetota bacterium]
MNIHDLKKPLTSKKLNENLGRQFGYKIALEKFTVEQLSDVRNKLRTEQSQFESTNSYDSVLGDHKYQKNQRMLDVINQELAERETTSDEEKAKEEKKKHKAKNLKEYHEAQRRLRGYNLPQQWTSTARQRLFLERDASDEIASELIIRYDLDETTAQRIIKDLMLTEGEEEKAELIMAAKDMVDRITGWLEDIASMKSEAMLDLLDSIRDEMGSDVSTGFEQTVRPALDEIYLALEKNRQLLAQAVSLLTGQQAPSGAGLGMGAPGGMGPPEMAGAEDMEAELGGEETSGEPAGRAMRETAAYSRRLASILSKKK